MNAYNMVTQGDSSTVVSEYTPTPHGTGYQSEADLENKMIELLKEQGYEHAKHIRDEKSLVANLRQQLEKLNDYKFSDDEWERFFRQSVAPKNEGVADRTRRIQRDHIQPLKRDDGTTRNIKLIDKENIHNNSLQVVNQYVQPGGKHSSRYNVTILVNGLPLVHSELKRYGVSIKVAFNQIKRYNRESFWVSSGLYQYVQIFVISNGTFTKYYSNTTRELRLKSGNKKLISDSFEFTSFWATTGNKPIPHLFDFTKTFLARRTILNILTRYCIFTEEEKLLVMQPYQIVATERILERVKMSSELKKTGTPDAGGYIWHTTGSGKTLTSFKTAQLATQIPGVNKVVFVVDRKDLDVQTVREYDRFQKGAANSNTSTKILQK